MSSADDDSNQNRDKSKSDVHFIPPSSIRAVLLVALQRNNHNIRISAKISIAITINVITG